MGAFFASNSSGSGSTVRMPVAWVIGAGMIISVLATQIMQDIERRRAQAAFGVAAEQAIDAIEDRIGQHIQLAHSITWLFHSSRDVERSEFATFVAEPLKRYPAIQTVGWVPRVSDIHREGVEAAVQREGFTAFAINERTNDGRWAQAGQRDEYFPTVYLEPRPANEATLGLDQAFNPLRRAALERARDTGNAALSAPVMLTLAAEPTSAIVVYAPIYADGRVPPSVELRRRDLLGFAFVQIRPARIAEVLEKIATGSRALPVRVDIFDTSDPLSPIYLFALAPGQRDAANPETPDRRGGPDDVVRSADFGGRQWTLIARAPVPASALAWQAWGALVGSLALTALLAAYLQTTLTRARAIENEVALRTNELNLANQLLHASEDRIRTIADSVPAMIAYVDRNLVYRFTNDHYRELGIDPGAMIGKTMREVRGDAAYEPVRHHFERAQAGEKVAFETSGAIAGEMRWWRIECTPDLAPDGSPRGFYVLAHDITALKAVDRMKDEFVSTVSHELRTPLTSIKGALGLIRIKARDLLSADMAQMLEIAYKNCDRLMLLINDILDIEKIEAGKMEFRMAPIDAVAIVRAAVAANKAYADQFGVTFEVSSGLASAMVIADEGRIMQVMANLLSNAAKFSPQGGTVTVAVERRAGGLRISVTDCGQGIPESQRGRLFQKFSQVDGSDRRKVGGTGLGLSIVRAIVEHHGGTADYASEVGVGTTFFVDLPEAKAEAAAQ